jgi:hypothetical protein
LADQTACRKWYVETKSGSNLHFEVSLGFCNDEVCDRVKEFLAGRDRAVEAILRRLATTTMLVTERTGTDPAAGQIRLWQATPARQSWLHEAEILRWHCRFGKL